MSKIHKEKQIPIEFKPLVGLVYDLRSEYIAEGYSSEDVAEFDSDETIDALEKTMQ